MPKYKTAYGYISDKEKLAIKILMQMEKTTMSKIVGDLLRGELKNRGILKEEFTEQGELVQKVIVDGVEIEETNGGEEDE